MADTENKMSEGSVLDQMSTEDLEELVRLDVQAAGSGSDNTDYTLRIMEVLAKRKKEDKSDPPIDVAAAWESFKETYLPEANVKGSIYDWCDGTDKNELRAIPSQKPEINPPLTTERDTPRKPRRNGRLLRPGFVAVIFIVIVAITGVVAIAVTNRNAIARMGRELFGYTDKALPLPINEGLESLHEALAEHGITERLAPAWIPDGFMLDDFSVFELPTRTIFSSYFENGATYMTVRIISYYDSPSTLYEKDDVAVEIYRRNDVEHVIMKNGGKVKVVWSTNNYECCISGDITAEEIKTMINSVYER